MTIRIGLTGPIGCGKSTVGRWLEERGAVLVDADAVAREVTAPGTPGHDAVLARFGAAVRAADGTLDRAALARIVFADADRLRDLEAIVHPVVRPALLGRIDEAQRAGAAVVVVEAIRLVEGGRASASDAVRLVTCAPRDQRRRLRQRGMEPTDALRRIEAQAGLEERLRPVASRVIDTSGSPAAARARVDAALDAALAAVRE